MSYYMGIDIGTYSSKGVLVRADGTIVATHTVPHDLQIPYPGWAEHDAETVWWSDLKTIAGNLLSKAGASGSDVRALGTSGVAPCVVPVSNEGRALRPAILYGIDTRATEEIAILNENLGRDRIIERTGAELSAQSAGPKVLWIRRNEPEIWNQTRYLLTSTSYLVFRLTGRLAIDHYTAAFYAPLYNVSVKQWWETACEGVCSEGMLPEPRWTTDVAGYVTEEAAEATGLAQGTPVIVGTADAASEAVGAGVFGPGETMVMYGSSVFIIRVFDSLPRGGIFWSAPFLFPGTYALAGGMSTTGAITQWFRDQFAADERAAEARGEGNAYELLARAASEISPGAEGLLALPYFSGERTPLNDPNARGIVAGLTLRHTRAHLYRALLEGVAFGVRHNFEEMGRSSMVENGQTEGNSSKGGAARKIVSIGGGSRNRPWMQIVADVLGRSHVVRDTPGASYGDAALAAVGRGDLQPSEILRWIPQGETVEANPKARRTYERLYLLYVRLYHETVKTVHELAGFSSEEG
ncbi:MAG: FGGY-family carbohydrate kinase [Spirochaetaceae bacterium]